MGLFYTLYSANLSPFLLPSSLELADDEEEEDCKEDGGEDVVAIRGSRGTAVSLWVGACSCVGQVLSHCLRMHSGALEPRQSGSESYNNGSLAAPIILSSLLHIFKGFCSTILF